MASITEKNTHNGKLPGNLAFPVPTFPELKKAPLKNCGDFSLDDILKEYILPYEEKPDRSLLI